MLKLTKLLLTASVVSLFFSGCSNSDKASFYVQSKNLKHTTISSHMEEPVSTGKNVVYCSTFQLAWNEFKDNITKGDIQLQNPPEPIKYLNKSLSTKKDLSDESYVAMAGMKKDDIIGRINKALKDKFKSEAPSVQENLQREDDILAYAYLYKNLQFNKEFEKLDNMLYFKNTKVKAFGIKKYGDKNKEMGEQVEVKYYREASDNKEFIVSLKAKNSTDDIILSAVQPKRTILETYNYVDELIKKNTTSMIAHNDKLVIPKFDFDISHSFDELLNKNLINKGFEDYYFVKATQDTRFKLDEKGVILKSEARLIATKSAEVSSPGRSMIFDHPFLLYMKEKNAAYPYFIMWIDNPELLVK